MGEKIKFFLKQGGVSDTELLNIVGTCASGKVTARLSLLSQPPGHY